MEIFNKILPAKALLLLFIITSGIAYGWQYSPVEFKLIHLLNQERNTPLIVNRLLNQVAEAQAQQIFISEFITGEAMDEEIFLSIEASGYRAVTGDGINAMVVFSNYLASETAAAVLFESLKKQCAQMAPENSPFSENLNAQMTLSKVSPFFTCLFSVT